MALNNQWQYCFCSKCEVYQTSVVVEWLRIHMPVLGTRVQSLVRRASTFLGAIKLVCHNCWACALQQEGPQQ